MYVMSYPQSGVNQKIQIPSFPTIWTANFSHFKSKIKNNFGVGLVYMFPKWYVLTTQHQNSQTRQGPGNRAFPDHVGGLGAKSPRYPTLQILYFAHPENFSQIHAFIKSYSNLGSNRDTDAQFASQYAWTRFFCIEIYTFHYTTFIHFAHSLRLWRIIAQV